MIIKRLLVLATPFFLLACSSVMTADECQSTNWHDRGLQDGLAGEYKDIFDEYTSACAAADVKPDRAQYSVGYLKGLNEFCTFENGHKQGLKKGDTHNCPTGSEYYDGHRKGIAKYKEEAERRAIEKLTRQQPNNTDVGAPGGQ